MNRAVFLSSIFSIGFALIFLGSCNYKPGSGQIGGSVCGPVAIAGQESWQQVLENDLHLLGHRNWILVVDKAFPEQSSPGMKYIYVEQDLIPTLKHVLEVVESSIHVSPIIYRDRELSFITENQAPGVEKFRESTAEIFEGRAVQTLLHDEVFKMLDESADLFRVLVIKTSCTIPYTSVFLQLDCSYWGAVQEEALRKTMAEAEHTD